MRIDTAAIDDHIGAVLAQSRVPGIAVAILHGGEVHAAGYGVRELASQAPMDAETLYPIASTTKPMNATLLAILASEGRFNWDDPVQRYLPEFDLAPGGRGEDVRLRDLVAMRTGLPRHDWVWLSDDLDRASLTARMPHLPLSAPLRSKFQYNNLTVTLAGHIAECMTGRTWEQEIKERILAPLGMAATGFAEPAMDANRTLGYREISGRRLVPARSQYSSLTAPSGGVIHSSVADMARWMAFNLSGKDQSLVAPEQFAELRRRQIAVGESLAGLGDDAAYGLGWIIDTHCGEPRHSHAGYISGVHSDLQLYPARELAILSVANFGALGIAGAINEQLFAMLAGRSPEPLTRQLAEYDHRVAQRLSRGAAAAERGGQAGPDQAAMLTGRYCHPGYGELSVSANGTELLLTKGKMAISLRHLHGQAWIAADSDQFEIQSPHPFEAQNPALFAPDQSVTVHFEPQTQPIRFAKLKASAAEGFSSINPTR